MSLVEPGLDGEQKLGMKYDVTRADLEERQILTHKPKRNTVWFILMMWHRLPQLVEMFVRFFGIHLLKLVNGFAFHY